MTDHHPWNRPTGDDGEAMPALPPLPGLPGSESPPPAAEPGTPRATNPEPQDGAPRPDSTQAGDPHAATPRPDAPQLGSTQPDSPHSHAPHSDTPHSHTSQPATRAEAREQLRGEAREQHRDGGAVETPWSSTPWGGPAQAPDTPPRIDTDDARTAQQVWPPREALEWEPTFAAGGHGDYADYAHTDEVRTHPNETADAERTDWTHTHADHAADAERTDWTHTHAGHAADAERTDWTHAHAGHAADASADGWEPESGTQPAHDASDHPWAQHPAVDWSQPDSATDADARSGADDAGHASAAGDPSASASGDTHSNGFAHSNSYADNNGDGNSHSHSHANGSSNDFVNSSTNTNAPTHDAWSYADSAPAASAPPKRRRRILIGALAGVVALAAAGGALALQSASAQLKYSLSASSDIASASVEFTAPKSWSEHESESFAQSWKLDDGCRFGVTHERFEDLPSLAPNDDHSPRSNIGRPANDAEATRKIALEWLELESHGDFLVAELEPRFGVATSRDGADEPLEFALYRADTPDTSRFVAVRAFNESTTALVVVMTCPDDRPLEYGEFAANLDALSFRLEPKGR